MEKFDLNDFQRKISQLSKKKEKINAEIDRQIEGLKIAQAVFRQDIDMAPDGAMVSTSETPNCAGMTTWQALSSILKENKGITSRKLIEIAREGGLDAREDTIRSTLSKRCKRGDIKVIKGKGERLYCFVENKTDNMVKYKQLVVNTNRFPWTEKVNYILKTIKKPLTLNEITSELVKMGKTDVTNTNNQAIIYSVVKRQTKRGLVGVDNSGNKLRYFWKGTRTGEILAKIEDAAG